MSEWMFRHLQHVALHNSGAMVTLKLEIALRDSAWHNIVTAHG